MATTFSSTASARYSPDGRRIVVDRVSRWDVEWRNYRGGQNTALTILDLGSLDEVRLPNERTTDTRPVSVGSTIYFLSDRDLATNVWAYDTGTRALRQVTRFTDADVKELAAGPGTLAIEQDGYLHLLDPATGSARRLAITVRGDFPWADPKWTDVSRSIGRVALSPTGKRALFEARGEVFTVSPWVAVEPAGIINPGYLRLTKFLDLSRPLLTQVKRHFRLSEQLRLHGNSRLFESARFLPVSFGKL